MLVIPDGEVGAPRKIAFLVAFAWLALSIVIHNRSRPSLGSIPAFSPLAPKAVVYGLTA
ncbi:hypothetical protein G6O45_31360 [Salmonella enterica subsp. enterica serovar Istanbul]|nr:hypothetical protein [Salmonella enterica subsp. enterica serovar Istanbul]